MEYGKYIIVLERGHLIPILFDSLIPHDTFLRCFPKANILSAGFFRTDRIKGEEIITFGKSINLDLSPNNGDNILIKKLLQGH